MGGPHHGFHHARHPASRSYPAETSFSSSQSRSAHYLAAFREGPDTTCVVGLIFGFMAFIIPSLYSETYALNIGIDQDLSFYLLSVMNAAGMSS